VEIEATAAALQRANKNLGENKYALAQPEAGAAAAEQPEVATADATSNNEDVVDADFKEVKRG
jgi:hypothetical protein